MRSNVRFLRENVGDIGTIVVSPPPVDGMPATNLQNDRRGAICRVSSTSIAIDINFDRPRKIGLLVVGRHNLTSLALWKREAWAGPNRTGTKVLDLDYDYIDPPVPLGEFTLGDGPLGHNRYTEWATADAVNWSTSQPWARSVRITIADPDNPAGYLQAARLLVGEYVEPLLNMSWEHKMDWVDESEQSRTEGNSLRTDRRDPYRKVELELAWNTDAEAATLMELSRINGKKKDIFISLYPGDDSRTKERDYQMITKLPEVPEFSPNFVNNFRCQLPFVES